MRHNSGTQALRCGIFVRDHGRLMWVVGNDVKFNGTTQEWEEKRRFEQRVMEMSKEEKAALLAKLLES